MWQYIDSFPESQVEVLWLRFKDMPFIFDDDSDGDFEKFKAKTLDTDTKWYQINNGYIMISDFGMDNRMAVWHTLVPVGALSYQDAWDIMLDAFDRFGIKLIVSGVPANHPRALRAAEKAGFVVIRISPRFFKRFGEMHDMHFMVITKEMVLCQQSQGLQQRL